MRTLSKTKIGGILFVPAFLLTCLVVSSSADITDGYPGYPNAWEGMTTNTIIKIDLDEPVAIIDDQPDMDYIVKKAAFNGFDFVSTELLCDVEVSDDRKTIRLYPQIMLEEDSFYAYKIERIVFEGGEEQEYTQCYSSGSNPSHLLKTSLDEADMCNDEGWHVGNGNFCARCHTDWLIYNDCVLLPEEPRP